MDFTAPAKINLFLRVLGKRKDGYHDIDTVFERISVFDTISVNIKSDSSCIICNDPSIEVCENSLLGKVVSGFKELYSGKEQFHIQVNKKIPVAAGLGGGSSDAATLLRALNKITGETVPEEALLNLCSDLGADIPFFFNDLKFGHGKNRGDEVKEIKTDITLFHILINPGIKISTETVYNRYDHDLNLTKTGLVDRMFSTFLEQSNIQRVVENIHNDLQTIVLRDFPEIKKAFSVLAKAGAEGVLMSGSGPTVFGLFDKERIDRAFEKVQETIARENNWKAFKACTC